MIRIQIRLDEQEYALVRKQAKALGISVAEFIRRAVRDKLPAPSAPWMRFAGMVESGNSRSSRTIDEIYRGNRRVVR